MLVSQVRFPRQYTLNRALCMANLLGNALESSTLEQKGKRKLGQKENLGYDAISV